MFLKIAGGLGVLFVVVGLFVIGMPDESPTLGVGEEYSYKVTVPDNFTIRYIDIDGSATQFVTISAAEISGSFPEAGTYILNITVGGDVTTYNPDTHQTSVDINQTIKQTETIVVGENHIEDKRIIKIAWFIIGLSALGCAGYHVTQNRSR